MNLKRIFGAVLTVLETGGLIYAAVLFLNGAGDTGDVKALIIYGILGFVFFIAGISLVRTTKDEASHFFAKNIHGISLYLRLQK